jgi:hypothetical protein
MAGQSGMVDPAIFEDLQARVDEDTAIRDVSALPSIPHGIILIGAQEMRDIIQTLEKQSKLGLRH